MPHSSHSETVLLISVRPLAASLSVSLQIGKGRNSQVE